MGKLGLSHQERHGNILAFFTLLFLWGSATVQYWLGHGKHMVSLLVHFFSSAKEHWRAWQDSLLYFCQRSLTRLAGQSSLLLPKSIEEDCRTGLIFFFASAKEHWSGWQDRSSLLLCFWKRALKRIAGQVFLSSLFRPQSIEEVGRTVFFASAKDHDCGTGLLFFIASAYEHWRELKDRSSFLLCFYQRALKIIVFFSFLLLPKSIKNDCKTVLLWFCQRALKKMAGQVFFSSLLLPKSIEEDGRTGLFFFIASAKEHNCRTDLLFFFVSAKEYWRELKDRSSLLLCFCQRELKMIAGQVFFASLLLPNQKASKGMVW